MCALAMMSFATQAQDDVLYEISSESATEVVDGHIYVLQNRAYPAYGLCYDNDNENGCATTYEWNENLLGQCMPYQYYFLTAGAYGITLPGTLTNINENGDMGYGDAGGGQVLSPRRNAAYVETTYFTVKDAAGQLAMLLEGDPTPYGVIYGGENTTPAECAQWIAYEVTEHEHNWEIVYDEDQSYCHHCTKCDVEERHYVTGEDGVCVCGYQCSEHSYHMDDYASVEATENADGQYIVVKICEYCQHEKTETVDLDGKCPKGGNHSWADDGTINATCTAKGYTYHICKKCEMLYVADFTDINPDNHDWLVEEQWNEEGELVSMHFCCNGCELYGQDQEHNMVDGKCTICGYWPGHTEHKWETDEYGHYCSIPGCEDYQDRQEHEIDENCTCTVCGYTCHEWNNGVCEICQVTCSHDHKYLVKGYAADCISDGWKEHYECEYCDAWLNDAGQPMTDEEFDLYIIPATGHLVNNEGICSVCENQITVADEFKWGETKEFEFMNVAELQIHDPMSYSLYQLNIQEGMVTQINLPEGVDSFVEPTEETDGYDSMWMLFPCATEEGGTRVGVGEYKAFNEPYNLTPGTYYMAPIMMSGWNEEVANVELTFPAVIAPCVDEEGNVTSVELTATTEGYAADADATVEIADGVSFTTPVDFTATGSQVTIDREFTQNTPATINLPFDVPAVAMGETYYTFGGIALNAETGKWEATMNEATGTLLANTPYIVLPEGTTLGISNTATVTFRADASANSSTTSGDWKMVSSVAKKVWSDDENADEIGKTYGFAGKSLTNADGVEIEAGQFVKVVAGAWIPAGRAYLTYKDESDPTAASHAPARTADAALPASISVRFVNADGTNGIGTLDTESGHMTIDAWYDLQGRRISEPKQGGIYIRNNKKITVK